MTEPILTPEEWAMPLDEFVRNLSGGPYCEWEWQLDDEGREVAGQGPLAIDGRLSPGDRLKLGVRLLHEVGYFTREMVDALRDAAWPAGPHRAEDLLGLADRIAVLRPPESGECA